MLGLHLALGVQRARVERPDGEAYALGVLLELVSVTGARAWRLGAQGKEEQLLTFSSCRRRCVGRPLSALLCLLEWHRLLRDASLLPLGSASSSASPSSANASTSSSASSANSSSSLARNCCSGSCPRQRRRLGHRRRLGRRTRRR